jgi:hypothetical protein
MDSLLKWHFSSVASSPLVLAPKVDQKIPIYSLYWFPSNYNKGFNHVHLYSPSLDMSFIFHAHISTGVRKYLQHLHLIEDTMMTHLPCTPHVLNPLESRSYTHNSVPYSMYFVSIFAIVITIDSLLKWHFSVVASNPLVLAPKVDRQIPVYGLYLFTSN